MTADDRTLPEFPDFSVPGLSPFIPIWHIVGLDTTRKVSSIDVTKGYRLANSVSGLTRNHPLTLLQRAAHARAVAKGIAFLRKAGLVGRHFYASQGALYETPRVAYSQRGARNRLERRGAGAVRMTDDVIKAMSSPQRMPQHLIQLDSPRNLRPLVPVESHRRVMAVDGGYWDPRQSEAGARLLGVSLSESGNSEGFGLRQRDWENLPNLVPDETDPDEMELDSYLIEAQQEEQDALALLDGLAASQADLPASIVGRLDVRSGYSVPDFVVPAIAIEASENACSEFLALPGTSPLLESPGALLRLSPRRPGAPSAPAVGGWTRH